MLDFTHLLAWKNVMDLPRFHSVLFGFALNLALHFT
jgi:hypothetical protein